MLFLFSFEMDCLHGKPASSSTTKNGSFWFCGQNPSCGFICTEEEGFLIQKAIAAWRSTNLEQPICETHRKPARFRVVKDMLKESFGRPYFTCSMRQNPCSLCIWADENHVEKPNCHQSSRTIVCHEES
jgi:ssDNA-binding Zn-finger/Zn-ribbon topoisomerase 1